MLFKAKEERGNKVIKMIFYKSLKSTRPAGLVSVPLPKAKITGASSLETGENLLDFVKLLRHVSRELTSLFTVGLVYFLLVCLDSSWLCVVSEAQLFGKDIKSTSEIPLKEHSVFKCRILRNRSCGKSVIVVRSYCTTNATEKNHQQ